MKVRNASADDFESVLSFCRELSADFDEKTLRRSFSEVLAQDHAAVLLAEVDGSPAGFLEVHLQSSLQSGSHALIRALFVAAQYRRQGIADALVTKAEEWVASRGIDKILVQSKVERAAAHEFYLGSGYEVFKVQNVYRKPLT